MVLDIGENYKITGKGKQGQEYLRFSDLRRAPDLRVENHGRVRTEQEIFYRGLN